MAINTDWMNTKWRPAMGWMYMTICITDFIIFPILWAIFKSYAGEPLEIWRPLTLEGAGLFHMAMGAVLGVAAWSRGREKLAGVDSSRRNYEYDAHLDEDYPRGHIYMSRGGRPAPYIREPEL